MTTASLPLQIIDVAERLSRSLALPEHLLRLLKMLDSQVISLSALAQALEEEPTLVARLMRIANSPFYGVAGRVDSISQALRILGTSNTQGFLTAMIAMSQLTRLPLPPAERDALQRHSLRVAFLARELALSCGLSQDTAFTAGLLHDFGRLVLEAEFPEAYAPVLAAAKRSPTPITELEQASLGFNHADVGAELARLWHYPARIEAAIRHHHAPTEQMEGVVLLIALANRLDNEDVRSVDLQESSWLRLGIQTDTVATALESSRQQVGALLAHALN